MVVFTYMFSLYTVYDSSDVITHTIYVPESNHVSKYHFVGRTRYLSNKSEHVTKIHSKNKADFFN